MTCDTDKHTVGIAKARGDKSTLSYGFWHFFNKSKLLCDVLPLCDHKRIGKCLLICYVRRTFKISAHKDQLWNEKGENARFDLFNIEFQSRQLDLLISKMCSGTSMHMYSEGSNWFSSWPGKRHTWSTGGSRTIIDTSSLNWSTRSLYRRCLV